MSGSDPVTTDPTTITQIPNTPNSIDMDRKELPSNINRVVERKWTWSTTQQEAIRLMSAGQNVWICGAAATGKTAVVNAYCKTVDQTLIHWSNNYDRSFGVERVFVWTDYSDTQRTKVQLAIRKGKQVIVVCNVAPPAPLAELFNVVVLADREY
jgi:hypothetical protein